MSVQVFDDVLPDPQAYRAAALAQPFGDVPIAPGVVFRGIAPAVDAALPAWIVSRFPHASPTLSFFRQSPAGQREPHYVHTDRDMGEWTAILYLNPNPAEGDGTRFWRDRLTGAIAIDRLPTDADLAAFRDGDRWACWHEVPARFNRVVLFPGAFVHSRALLDNYGEGADARLIQVVFGHGSAEAART